MDLITAQALADLKELFQEGVVTLEEWIENVVFLSAVSVQAIALRSAPNPKPIPTPRLKPISAPLEPLLTDGELIELLNIIITIIIKTYKNSTLLWSSKTHQRL